MVYEEEIDRFLEFPEYHNMVGHILRFNTVLMIEVRLIKSHDELNSYIEKELKNCYETDRTVG